MGKCSLQVLTALLLVSVLASPLSAMTLAEAKLRAQQSGSEPLRPPQYVPEDARSREVKGLKSPWSAMGLSLLIPGAGQIYGGAGGRGKVFLGAEAVVWTVALGFDRWSAWRNNDAVDYAVEHAQLSPDGKDDQFLEYLEFYDNREEFNRAGRIIDPSRAFLPETREYYWQWDSYQSRRIYRDIRNSADAASRNATFMVYIAALNRVLAAADAFRLVSRNNSRARHESGLKLSVKPHFSWHHPSVMVHARYRF